MRREPNQRRPRSWDRALRETDRERKQRERAIEREQEQARVQAKIGRPAIVFGIDSENGTIVAAPPGIVRRMEDGA